MLKTMLIVSLLGNAVLMAIAWLAAERDTPSLVMAAPTPSGSATATRDERSAEPDFHDDEAATLLLAALEARELGAIDNPWDRYWSAREPRLAHAEAVRDAYGRIRAELVRRYGDAAAAMPQFARAFRPLDAEAGFLSSTEQLELQRRRLAAAVEQSGQSAQPLDSGRAVQGGVELDFLLPAAALEVRLRQSPLAAQLRASGVDFDEHEFRSAFEILERANATPDIRARVATTHALTELLGTDRAATVLSVRDPLWPMTERIAREHGRDVAAAKAAYAALSEAQQQLLELALDPHDAAAVAASVNGITERERNRLADALGEAGAEALLLARDALGGRLTRPESERATSSFN